MRKFVCGLLVVAACVAGGCGGPAAKIPDATIAFDSNRDKEHESGPGGGGQGGGITKGGKRPLPTPTK